MKSSMVLLVLATTLVLTPFSAGAAAESSAPPQTVAQAHPRLALGALTFAQVTTLPDELVLRAGAVRILSADVDKTIAAQPPELREDLQKNAYLVLAQQATGPILQQLARASLAPETLAADGEPERTLIQRYLEAKVLSRVTVTEAEIKALYEAEKGMLGNATLDEMRSTIKQYLLKEKQQEAITAYIRDLGKSTRIEVSASWLKKQAESARDNPVDKARDSGIPSLVEFGATGCGPCDLMAPILDTLRGQFKGKLNVLFVNVREQQILGAKYAIQNIPVQVFFDKQGNEAFRHVGFFSQADVESKLLEMGVK